MKTAILSDYTAGEYEQIAQLTRPTLARYAERHGYDLIGGLVTKSSRHLDWDRMARVANALDEYEAVMWIDCDAKIMDESVRIQDRVNQFDDLVMTTDINGPNIGVFIARSTPIVRQFFYALNGMGYDCYKDHLWQVQAALCAILANPPYDSLVTWVPQREMNSYPHEMHDWPDYDGWYEPGDWIVHLAGVANEKRLAYFRRIEGAE
jgi:hypothetical protein